MLDFPGYVFFLQMPLHSEGPGPGPGPHWARVPNGPGELTYGPTLGLGWGGGMSHTDVGWSWTIIIFAMIVSLPLELELELEGLNIALDF